MNQWNPNEIGAAICRFPSGQFTFGPWSQGGPASVNIQTRCPNGSQFWGIYHTHPKGVALPSQQDIRSALESGARLLCINATSPGGQQDLRCFVRRNQV